MASPKDNFKALQKKWYSKLKKEGFEDIEQDEENLKVWSQVFFGKHSIEQIQAKQAYYQMATNFLEEYPFETERDRIIWEYHANGISAREIVVLFKKIKIKINFMKVWRLIKKHRVKMYQMYMEPHEPYTE